MKQTFQCMVVFIWPDHIPLALLHSKISKIKKKKQQFIFAINVNTCFIIID